MGQPQAAVREHTFTFGNHTLTVECRKTLEQTINFQLTVQCEIPELFESLRGFGGGFPESSSSSSSSSREEKGDGLENVVDDIEDTPPDYLGLDIWPAALELCGYLKDHPTIVEGASVAELGAGVGLPALLAARLGATRVVISDYEPIVVSHVTRNAQLSGVSDRCSGLRLDWTKLDALHGTDHLQSYDVVLAADVLYIADIMGAFLDALVALLRPKSGVAIIGHQMRRALVIDDTGTPETRNDDVAFRKFSDLCCERGLHTKILSTKHSPGFPGPMLLLAVGHKAEVLDLVPIP
jgi:predicted nicotinamide N-methyase